MIYSTQWLSICLSIICAMADQPTVNIPQGTLAGVEISPIRTQRIHGYLAIPYAQPPVKKLRFMPPVSNPLPSWENTRNASEFAAACIQSDMGFQKADETFFYSLFPDKKLQFSEDCLYLNVYVPYGISPPDGYAVMVWIHPGNFSNGFPSIWNPYTLVFKQRVIVVTFAYRLNIFGFFTSMDGEAPGNYGLMDQVAALKWVRENIRAFNGNPNNVCVFGYEAGAISTSLMLISPQVENLFAKAIIMNGNAFSPNAIRSVTDLASDIDYIADYFGCFRYPTSKMMECMRKAANIPALFGTSRNFTWGPIYDTGLSNDTKPFVSDTPLVMFNSGNFISVPMLTGYSEMGDVLNLPLESREPDNNVTVETLEEVAEYLVRSDLPTDYLNRTCSINNLVRLVSFYYTPALVTHVDDQLKRVITRMDTDKKYGSTCAFQANHIASKTPNVYVYRFDYKLRTPTIVNALPNWVTVPRLFDLIYVWGMPFWADVAVNWDAADKQTSDIIMNFWANFAKSSDPTKSQLYPIEWRPYRESQPNILLINPKFEQSNPALIDYKSFQFWNVYYPQVVEMSVQYNCDERPSDDSGVATASPCYVLAVAALFVRVVLR